jgi:hypothetical protein
VTLTADVLATAPGSGTPTGTVTFDNGKKKLGNVTLSDGVAALQTKKLTKGAHMVTVVYHGDSDFTGNTSTGLREVIRKPAKPKKPKISADSPVELIDPTGKRASRRPEKPAVAKRLHDLALDALSGEAHVPIERQTDAT